MSKRSAQTSRPAKRIRSSKPQPRRKLTRQLGVEVKYFDAPVGFNAVSSVDWTGSESGPDMPQIPQGDDVFQRNGRKIQLNRVMFRGTVFTSTTTAQTLISAPISVRVLLVQNKQPNTNSLTGNTVMGLNGGAAANAAVAMHMFQGVQGFGRYKVVDDMTIDIDTTAAVNNAAGTTVSAAAAQKSFTLQYRPKKPITMEFAGSATAIPNTNSFNLIANCEGTTFTPNITGVLRFYYTDV
jgi:hypothetical protein